VIATKLVLDYGFKGNILTGIKNEVVLFMDKKVEF